MGSGSTGVAALDAGRNFIGIEKYPDFFQMARKRLEGVPIIAV
jgi:site-specific DNA-methyltransferase (adenine-specific)